MVASLNMGTPVQMLDSFPHDGDLQRAQKGTPNVAKPPDFGLGLGFSHL